ncbi:hypothetical protein QL285_060231 [Trifolium repens]|nr:hypothetical protein QL285_060231 [Trifolium repens]
MAVAADRFELPKELPNLISERNRSLTLPIGLAHFLHPKSLHHFTLQTPTPQIRQRQRRKTFCYWDD